MSRSPDYEFIPTDVSALMAQMISDYEALTGETVYPASPERLMISWVAHIIMADRMMLNYAANQNLPSRADGQNLDALAELFYSLGRPAATVAVCTVRFNISAVQTSAVLIPAGTRVTDGGQKLYWETVADAWIDIGDTYVDAQVRCQTAGTVGNGYSVGSINTIVDVYDYYSTCANTTVSDGGSDQLTDDEFYEYLRASLDSFSTAGPRGSYIFHAKAVSSEIADVVVNSPAAGEVRIYVLMDDGTIAGTTMKGLVAAACNDENVRPLTDKVIVSDPSAVSYDVTLTYYISNQASSSAEIDAAVASAVDEYNAWQCGKLGRDINPSKLISMVMAVPGVKRVEVTAPVYTQLQDGEIDPDEDPIILAHTIPEVGEVGNINLTNGGVENE